MDTLLHPLGLHSPALFALSILVLNATPGVDVLCITSSTLKGGARAGVAAAVGISLGCVVHALLAAFGLAALLAVSAWAFGALKLAGAAYLAWLAWGMLRAAWRPANDAGGTSAPASTTATGVSTAEVSTALSPERLALRQGLLTNLLNPKVALFYLAFLPQFIQPSTEHKTLAFLVLGAWFVLQSLAFLLVLVAVLLRLRGLGQRAWVRRSVQGLGGVLFLALAGRLLSARNA